jgi:UDP-N-acetylmuramoyl-tripeptide--D-alanyl-D-alanine ligase
LKVSLAELASWCGGKAVGSESVRITGVSTDTRTLRPGELFVAIRGPNHDGHDFLDQASAGGATALLVSRPTDAPTDIPRIEVEDTLFALGEIARAYRIGFRGPVIAITGSNGKTTTKEMCAEILEAAGLRVRRSPRSLNNAIGLPLSILGLEESDEALVLELGTNHPGEIDALGRIADPSVGAITQVAHAHLEGFGSIEAVARAKAELLDRIAEGGGAVLNADDPHVVREAARFEGRTIWFGLDRRAEFRAEDVRAEGVGVAFRLCTSEHEVDVRIALPGRHLVGLALCAAACAFASGRLEGGAGLEAVRTGLERFQGVPGRLRLVRNATGVVVLDDTYNANPASVLAALCTLRDVAGDGRRVAVLGDMLELGEAEASLHAEVGETAARLGVEVLVAVGLRSRPMAESAQKSGVSTVVVADDAEGAARLLPGLVRAGDTVLVKGSRGMRMERALTAIVEEEA